MYSLPMTHPSTRHIKYECTVCGDEVGRENLVAKQVIFVELGEGGKRLQSRTVGWVCFQRSDEKTPCILSDPAWTQERFAGAPGMQHTRLARDASV